MWFSRKLRADLRDRLKKFLIKRLALSSPNPLCRPVSLIFHRGRTVTAAGCALAEALSVGECLLAWAVC